LKAFQDQILLAFLKMFLVAEHHLLARFARRAYPETLGLEARIALLAQLELREVQALHRKEA
jgi:hypothetical protein